MQCLTFRDILAEDRPEQLKRETDQVAQERTINTKLLIYGLFQKGRVLAQDDILTELRVGYRMPKPDP